MILPRKRHIPRLTSTTQDERVSLADIMKVTICKIRANFTLYYRS